MNTHNISFSIYIKKIPYIFSNLWDFFPRDLNNDFKTAVVNEPSAFEPLKIYCMKFQNAKLSNYDTQLRSSLLHLD